MNQTGRKLEITRTRKDLIEAFIGNTIFIQDKDKSRGRESLVITSVSETEFTARFNTGDIVSVNFADLSDDGFRSNLKYFTENSQQNVFLAELSAKHNLTVTTGELLEIDNVNGEKFRGKVLSITPFEYVLQSINGELFYFKKDFIIEGLLDGSVRSLNKERNSIIDTGAQAESSIETLNNPTQEKHTEFMFEEQEDMTPERKEELIQSWINIFRNFGRYVEYVINSPFNQLTTEEISMLRDFLGAKQEIIRLPGLLIHRLIKEANRISKVEVPRSEAEQERDTMISSELKEYDNFFWLIKAYWEKHSANFGEIGFDHIKAKILPIDFYKQIITDVILPNLAAERIANSNLDNLVNHTISEEETIVDFENGTKGVQIEYPKKAVKDGNESVELEYIKGQGQSKMKDIAMSIRLKARELAIRARTSLKKPEDFLSGDAEPNQKTLLEAAKKAEEANFKKFLLPLNNLMMILNAKVARIIPGLTSSEIDSQGREAIAEDFRSIKERLGIDSLTNAVLAEVYKQVIPILVSTLKEVMLILGRNEHTIAVKLGYQGSGKGSFDETNSRLAGIFAQKNYNPRLRRLLDNTLRTDFAIALTGTDGYALPKDGDTKTRHTAPIARTTISKVIQSGTMADDSFMTAQVLLKMIGDVICGYSGSVFDTFPRTPGQFEIINGIIGDLAEDGLTLSPQYQLYEMANQEEVELIKAHTREASKASTKLGIKLKSISGKIVDIFPDSHDKMVDYINARADYIKTRFGITADLLVNYVNRLINNRAEISAEEHSLYQDIALDVLQAYYAGFANSFEEHLLSDSNLDSEFGDITEELEREILIKIYSIHVRGIAKIIRTRLHGRFVGKSARNDEAILASIVNRFRSTEQTIAEFVDGVAQEIIPVDGDPREAWKMMMTARLKTFDPDLYKVLIEGKEDSLIVNLDEIKRDWEDILESGANEHNRTINPTISVIEN